jgi:hypothetical protein
MNFQLRLLLYDHVIGEDIGQFQLCEGGGQCHKLNKKK